MTKPHEQEWRVEETPYGNGRRIVVRNGDNGTVAEFPAYDPPAALRRRPNAALASAAPDMARALLMWLPDNGHTAECGNGSLGPHNGSCSTECETTRNALRKAGVLP